MPGAEYGTPNDIIPSCSRGTMIVTRVLF